MRFSWTSALEEPALSHEQSRSALRLPLTTRWPWSLSSWFHLIQLAPVILPSHRHLGTHEAGICWLTRFWAEQQPQLKPTRFLQCLLEISSLIGHCKNLRSISMSPLRQDRRFWSLHCKTCARAGHRTLFQSPKTLARAQACRWPSLSLRSRGRRKMRLRVWFGGWVSRCSRSHGRCWLNEQDRPINV